MSIRVGSNNPPSVPAESTETTKASETKSTASEAKSSTETTTAPPPASAPQTAKTGGAGGFAEVKGVDTSSLVQKNLLNAVPTGGKKSLPETDKSIDPNSPLYVKGAGDKHEIDMNDVKQGGLADCFVMAPIAAVAAKDPEAVKKMIQDNGDGTYTVTFKEKKWGLFSDSWVDKKVTVKGDFPASGHANTGDAGAGGKAEVWPLIIEKAYAQYKGGYDKISEGGDAGKMIEALTGKSAVHTDPDDLKFDKLKKDFDAGKPVVFLTPEGNKKKETASPYGLHNWHYYVVKDVYTDDKGNKMVQLHNPWGSDHPKPIPFDQVKHHFSDTVSN